MAQTLFFEERLKGFRPFPLLLFEGLERVSKDAGVEIDESTVVQLLADALQALKFPEHDFNTAAEYAVRMSEMLEVEQDAMKEVQAEVKQAVKKDPGKRSFGQAFLEWAQGLERDGLCLYLANYDVAQARYLYCEEDRAVVMRAFHLKLADDWHKIEAELEAVVFGMGGGGGGEEAGVEVFDLSSDDEEESRAAMQELQSFFRGN